MSWLGRPSSYPSANDGGFTTQRLMVSSVSFWLILCALGLIFLVDFSIAPTLQVSLFASWQNAQSFLFCVIVFALLAGLLGTIAALPSAIINRLFNPQIESLYRRSWSLPKARIVLFKYSSLALLIVSNFILLSLSLASAPQYARGRSSQPGIVASWSQFVHDLLYTPRLKKRGQQVISQLGPQISAKTYLVFVPSSVLSQPDVYVRVRKEIGEPYPFLIDAPDFSTQIIQMLDGAPDFYQTFSGPLLTMQTLATEPLDLSLGTLMGLSDAQINVRLSPELKALEQSFSNHEHTADTQSDSSDDSDAQTTIKKRMVMSQPHLFLPFRLGLGAIFDKAWEWTDLVADDGIEIINTLSRQLTLKQRPALTIIQLNELEQTPSSIFHPYANVRWPSISGLLEKQKIVSRSDELLSQLASVIKKTTQSNLFILPYPDLRTTRQVAWAFVHLADDNPLKDRFTQNLKSHGWLTSLAASDYLHGSLVPLTSKTNEEKANNDTLCQPILYAFGKNDATQTMLNAWSFVSLNNKQNFEVASDLRFLFKTRSNYAVFCKNTVSEAPHRRTNGYIFQFLMDENLNTNDKQLLASLFQSAVRLEAAAGRKNRVKDPSMRPVATTKESEALALLSRIKIYRVIEQDFRQFDISPLADSQLEPVVKTFYDEFTRVSNEISHGQLFWD